MVGPGGEMILVNHFGAEARVPAAHRASFAAITRRLGWRPEFPWAQLANWSQRHGKVRLIEGAVDAAARSLLANSLCQGRCRCRDCRRGAGRALILPVSLSAPILVAPVLLAPLQFAPLQLPLQRAPLQFAPIVPFV